jgi:hypothetical protein
VAVNRSHLCTSLYISLVIFHRKCTGARENDLTAGGHTNSSCLATGIIAIGPPFTISPAIDHPKVGGT